MMIDSITASQKSISILLGPITCAGGLGEFLLIWNKHRDGSKLACDCTHRNGSISYLSVSRALSSNQWTPRTAAHPRMLRCAQRVTAPLPARIRRRCRDKCRRRDQGAQQAHRLASSMGLCGAGGQGARAGGAPLITDRELSCELRLSFGELWIFFLGHRGTLFT